MLFLNINLSNDTDSSLYTDYSDKGFKDQNSKQ